MPTRQTSGSPNPLHVAEAGKQSRLYTVTGWLEMKNLDDHPYCLSPNDAVQVLKLLHGG